MALFDPAGSVSKESPSSLLPPPPARSFFGRKAEPVGTHGPSSLLPDESQSRYPGQQDEETVAVSPSALLPPVSTGRAVSSAKRKVALVGAALLVVVALIAVLALRAGAKSIPELMQEAAAFSRDGKHDSAAIQLKNVLTREPDNVEANVLIGEAYLAAGALLDAEAALRRAREVGAPAEAVMPDLLEVLIRLERHEDALKALGEATNLTLPGARGALLRGRAYLGLGNLLEAKTQFTIARGEAPSEASAYLARVMMQEGNPEGAGKMIDDVLAADPKATNAWIAKGDLLRGQGESAEALVAYRKAQELQPDSMDAIVGAAVALIGRDEFGLARRELSKGRAFAPSSHLLGFVNALLAFRERRYEDCRDILASVLAAVPRHMPSVLLAGALNFAVGDIEQAHDAFSLYLTRFPGHLQARKMYAITLLRKDQAQAAADNLAPFLGFDIRDPEFFAVAGQAFRQIGALDRARKLLTKATALDPNNADAFTDLGLTDLSAGATNEGIAELEKAVALRPRDSRPDRHLALIFIANDRLDDAFAVADRLEKRLSGIPEPDWIRGLVFAANRDDAKARESFERALNAHPAFFPAAAALAELDSKEGKPARSRARFAAVLERNPRSVEAALALAQVDAAEGKLNDAIARARRAASDNPNSVLAQQVLARLELDAGKTDEALNAARRAREINPRDPSAVELLGLTQMATGDTAGAVLSFTTLVNMRPRYVPGRMRLVETLRSTGDRRTALAAARELLVVAPRNADALTALGTLLLEDKRYDEALAVAGEAKSKHPKRALGHAMEGEIRMAQSDPTAALAAFRRADGLEPSGRLRIRMHQAESAWLGHDAPVGPLLDWIKQSPDDIGVRVYCADTLVRLSRTGEAIPLYLEALEKAPQDFRLLNNIADALMRQGDPKALDYAHQAFQLRPSDPIVAATLGTALLRSGKIYEAVQLLQKAAQMASEHAEIQYQFVLALTKAGDRVRAKAELQRLLESGKVFPQRTEAQVLVKQL